MTKVLQRPTLVLNRNWQPINVATVARALIMLSNEAAKVVDPADYQLYDWNDWSKLVPDQSWTPQRAGPTDVEAGLLGARFQDGKLVQVYQ